MSSSAPSTGPGCGRLHFSVRDSGRGNSHRQTLGGLGCAASEGQHDGDVRPRALPPKSEPHGELTHTVRCLAALHLPSLLLVISSGSASWIILATARVNWKCFND